MFGYRPVSEFGPSRKKYVVLGFVDYLSWAANLLAIYLIAQFWRSLSYQQTTQPTENQLRDLSCCQLCQSKLACICSPVTLLEEIMGENIVHLKKSSSQILPTCICEDSVWSRNTGQRSKTVAERFRLNCNI